MPIYLYWGEDDFSRDKAVATLKQSVLDPSWSSFNFDKILPDQPNAVIFGLNQAMTPPFGLGSRLVWLVNSPLTHHCSPELLQELERTLPILPDTTTLLLTSPNKPDGRLKSTKLLQKYATLREFSPIPPWKTEKLVQRVQTAVAEVGIQCTPEAIAALAEAVGNDTRQLYNELEKLRLYSGSQGSVIDVGAIAALVQVNTQSSLKLAGAIKSGETAEALTLIAELIAHNEPALRIIATLVAQFRTWLWVKLMIEMGVRDEREIAQAAEVGNPKRIYFLRKEVQSVSLMSLRQTLPQLLEFEILLKRGAQETATLQTAVIQLCRLFQPGTFFRE
jgi:DNA polymerase-3 subunit delta